MKKPLHFLLGTLLLLTTLTCQARAEVLNPAANGDTTSLAPILEKIMPAVVNITAQGQIQNTRSPFAKMESPNQQKVGDHFMSLGSGVILDAKNGYIITNAHVIYDADNITVTLNDGRRYKARTLGMDTNFDIAVLHIDANNLVEIPQADSRKLRIGDFVMAIGSPFNLKQTVTSGIISGLHRSINIEGNEDFIQTDASINFGSSGGALVNLQGQLIGINTAIFTPDGGSIGIGFAVPLDLANQVMIQILQYGKVEHGMLGILIQDLTPDLADSFHDKNAHGAVVSQVNPISPAYQAGLHDGDIIVSVNDIPVDTSADLRNRITLLRPNTKVTLGIIRNGKSMQITTSVIDNKEYKKRAMARLDRSTSLLAGVSLQNFDQLTLNYGYVKGVQVAFVDQNSDAWSAMLRPGDVILTANQRVVTDIPSLQNILKDSKNKLLLHVLRADGAFYLTIP